MAQKVAFFAPLALCRKLAQVHNIADILRHAFELAEYSPTKALQIHGSLQKTPSCSQLSRVCPEPV
jgi:hypothetical protein